MRIVATHKSYTLSFGHMHSIREHLLSWLLLLLSLTFSFRAVCQTSPVFSYSTVAEQKILQALNTRLEHDLKALTGPNKKYLSEIYKERFAMIETRVKAKEVLTDVKAQEYLNALTKEIFRNNTKINKEELRIHFSRIHWPNASSMGEGTILFNIGLFGRLENESQAAFVLCHEIAHFFLNHSNNNINGYVNTVYSDSFQQQLKNIKKTGYGQNNQLEDLSKRLLFKNRHHSREFEQSADSMAMELMKNTGFSCAEALNCLAILDSVDKEKYGPADVSKAFSFPAFSFKKQWLQSDDLIFSSSEDEETRTRREKDSLKTHPACSTRIARLTPVVNGIQNTGKKFLVSESYFLQLQKAFDYEEVAYCIELNMVSRALFLSLQMLETSPRDAFLTATVGKCLNQVFSYQKKHELNKIVDLPNPQYDSAYNDLLRLLQNLRLQEIAALSYYYLRQHEEALSDDENFVAALIRSKENFGMQLEAEQWKKHYNTKFPSGSYSFK